MLGLSQSDLCARAGVGRKLLNGFEGGERLVRERNVDRIRAALEQAGARFQYYEDGSVAVRVAVRDAPERGPGRPPEGSAE